MSGYYDQATGEFVDENEVPSDGQTNLVPMNQVATQITGPFVPYEAKYGQSSFSLAERKLAERTDLTIAQRYAMLASYSHDKVDLLEEGGHMNEVMSIIGAMVKYHEPFKPKSGENIIKPGYFRMILKTNIKVEVDMVIRKKVVTFNKNLLLSVSANEVVKYFLTIIESDKWYDFDSPITGYFSGSRATGYTFSVLTDDEAITVAEILAQVKE
jgi:hypothetical protein